MSRTYPERPIIGVGIVLLNQGKVLLIKRGKPPRQGQWSIPGGGVELGETLEDAVRRELKEETGLETGTLQFLKIVELIDRDESGRVRHHYTLADYAGHYQGGQIIPGSDAVDAKWFDQNAIENLPLWQETRDIIQLALALPPAQPG